MRLVLRRPKDGEQRRYIFLLKIEQEEEGILYPLPSSILYSLFCFIPLRTFCFIHSSLIPTKSSAIIFFTDYPLHKKAFDLLQGEITSEVGVNNEMLRCSVIPAVIHLLSSKKASSRGMTTNCCLFKVVHKLFLVLLDAFLIVIQH